MISPGITAIIIAIAAALSFGAGFAIENWRTGGQIARLESNNAVLKSANGDCATDIQNVKKQVGVIVTMVEEREKAASDAMKTADLLIAERKKQIRTTKVYPPVAPTPTAQCAAIIREQLDYVQARHNAAN